jgi:ubiquinone/menaquinone biosynthesis C-methylase UbiE
MKLSDILLPNRNCDLVSPGIWSTLPAGQRANGYDRMAKIYDRVVGNALYNRVVWGASVHDYADTAQKGLAEAVNGPILDCGCGSLVFTADAYKTATLNQMILFDRSLGMMQRGAARLRNGQFVQGDAFDLPFRDASFDTVFAWGFLHVVGTKSPLLEELHRVAAPNATIILSSLVLTKHTIGNKMLALLHRQGEAAAPESQVEVTLAFSDKFEITSHSLHGSMLVLHGKVRA